ncbi:MAG TPA: chemotaxis response regulator protein-glutamate methylesterase [Blastocatellia bacterium]|nr:chemotaxis response regulator protein-glutamate methylesterase [Blastocatellia bacterium]HMX29966.1 chemotaxis response regulator protein-glutamate methylesterase [Blastocatellia bacterium]HMZ20034.1 chemotaxis response regulator protein-glutamate methylesterase [Blastocatellia bacterium]HNG33519.1 chemotaxis response regulator protein-glutamate methylesterase [Blastocatellia bacterium]
MTQIIKVLVVDDSAYVRKVVRQMLSRSPFIEVVGAARDGKEALELVEQLRPDVVTCDLMMPELDGVGFVREQMRRRPVPIVIVSIASRSGETALAALDAGAIDFVRKPTALATEKVLEISDELIEKVKAVAAAPLRGLLIASPPALPPLLARAATRVDIVVIGISTGGPQALKYLIPQLPADFPVPVAMVLHMPVGYTELYARSLDNLSPLRVVEAREGEPVNPGTVLLAPAGRHLLLRRGADGRVIAQLDTRPFDTPHRPAVDVLFQSAAEVFGERVLGVVMTGMGADGKQGAAWIKAQGGCVLTEAESSCVVYGMPRAVAEAGLSDASVPLGEMARTILERL